jgi:hypothetical protein
MQREDNSKIRRIRLKVITKETTKHKLPEDQYNLDNNAVPLSPRNHHARTP